MDSSHFVIGGGLSSASDLVLPAAREYLSVSRRRARGAPDHHGDDVTLWAAIGRDGRDPRRVRRRVKHGALLPTFRDNADDALAFADEAARAGLDGVFAFDHLWPMVRPNGPSLAPFPVLAAMRCVNRHSA